MWHLGWFLLGILFPCKRELGGKKKKRTNSTKQNMQQSQKHTMRNVDWIIFLYLHMFVLVCAHAWQSTCIVVRRWLDGVGSFLLPCEIWGLNQHHWTQHQAPLPVDPSCYLWIRYFYICIFLHLYRMGLGTKTESLWHEIMMEGELWLKV